MTATAKIPAPQFSIGQAVVVDLPDGTPVSTQVRLVRRERSRWSRTGYVTYYAMEHYVGPSWVQESAVVAR